MRKHDTSRIDAWFTKLREEHDPAVNSFLATHFESQEEHDEAFSRMELALRKSRQKKSLCEKLVWIAYGAQRLDQARKSIESSFSNCPEDYRISRALGLIYLLSKEYSLAAKNLKKSLKLKKDEGLTHFLLGYSFLALSQENGEVPDSGSGSLSSIQQEFRKASEMVFFSHDRDFGRGLDFLDKGLFSQSLEEMSTVLARVRELQVEPVSFSRLALSFLTDQRVTEQNQVECALGELRECREKAKEYPGINNHLGLCFLIFWTNLVFQAENQLRLAVEKDSKFQKAKDNLEILENSSKKISALVKELRF